MPSPTFFEPLEAPGALLATERTAGPWSSELMHAGPPSALLVDALEALDPDPGPAARQLGRVAIDLLGPLVLGEVEIAARVVRPGRAVELLEAELRIGGRATMRAQAWRVAAATTAAGPAEEPTPALPDVADEVPGAIGAPDAYVQAIEWRSAAGDWHGEGPATVWGRPRIPLLPGRKMSPLQRLVCVCDSASGVSRALPWAGHLFINVDLVVHVARPPHGEWVCVDAVTRIPEGGLGLCTARLGDADGYLGTSAQSLLVRER